MSFTELDSCVFTVEALTIITHKGSEVFAELPNDSNGQV